MSDLNQFYNIDYVINVEDLILLERVFGEVEFLDGKVFFPDVDVNSVLGKLFPFIDWNMFGYFQEQLWINNKAVPAVLEHLRNRLRNFETPKTIPYKPLDFFKLREFILFIGHDPGELIFNPNGTFSLFNNSDVQEFYFLDPTFKGVYTSALKPQNVRNFIEWINKPLKDEILALNNFQTFRLYQFFKATFNSYAGISYPTEAIAIGKKDIPRFNALMKQLLIEYRVLGPKEFYPDDGSIPVYSQDYVQKEFDLVDFDDEEDALSKIIPYKLQQDELRKQALLQNVPLNLPGLNTLLGSYVILD